MGGKRYAGIRTAEGKTCSICKRMLPFSEYHQKAGMRDGFLNYCKTCKRKKVNDGYLEGRGQKLLKNRKSIKATYAEKMGGKCWRCGYDEFMSGLDFHHLSDKTHKLSDLLNRVMQGKSNLKNMAVLEAELSKCILLCRNCHCSLHAGEWSAPDLLMEKAPRLEPEIEYRTDELAYLPLFEN